MTDFMRFKQLYESVGKNFKELTLDEFSYDEKSGFITIAELTTLQIIVSDSGMISILFDEDGKYIRTEV